MTSLKVETYTAPAYMCVASDRLDCRYIVCQYAYRRYVRSKVYIHRQASATTQKMNVKGKVFFVAKHHTMKMCQENGN